MLYLERRHVLQCFVDTGSRVQPVLQAQASPLAPGSSPEVPGWALPWCPGSSHLVQLAPPVVIPSQCCWWSWILSHSPSSTMAPWPPDQLAVWPSPHPLWQRAGLGRRSQRCEKGVDRLGGVAVQGLAGSGRGQGLPLPVPRAGYRYGRHPDPLSSELVWV